MSEGFFVRDKRGLLGSKKQHFACVFIKRLSTLPDRFGYPKSFAIKT